MITKLILLFCGITQMYIPDKVAKLVFSHHIQELSIQLEMIAKDDHISYSSYLGDFYTGLALPGLSESYIFELGDGDGGRSTWWFSCQASQTRRLIDFARKEMKHHPFKDHIQQKIDDLEVIYEIYDKIDDACSQHFSPMKRRKALQFLYETLGKENYYHRRLPDPVLFLYGDRSKEK